MCHQLVVSFVKKNAKPINTSLGCKKAFKNPRPRPSSRFVPEAVDRGTVFAAFVLKQERFLDASVRNEPKFLSNECVMGQ